MMTIINFYSSPHIIRVIKSGNMG